MLLSNFSGIRIAAIATAVPKNMEILSEKYNDIFGEKNVSKFTKSTGVYERHIALEEQTASDLAYVAAEKIINEKQIDRKEIGICVFVIQTPDYRIPSTACVLHKRLGLSKDCIAFDINLGCSGWVYGLQVVCSLLQSIPSKYALLLVGDTPNKVIAPLDHTLTMLFGDSGAATLLEKSLSTGSIRIACRTDGNGFKAIIIPSGACRNRFASHERVLQSDGIVRSDYDECMNGLEVFTFSITEVPEIVMQFLDMNILDKDDFDCYVFHQANIYILKQLIKKLKLDKEKMPISIDRYGNNSVSSIPLTLCDCYGNSDEDAIKNVLACGFGIGLSWGVAAFKIDTTDIFPIIETEDYYKDGNISHI